MNYILGKGQHRRYINSLAEQDFLLCPKFYTIKNGEDELIFLLTNQQKINQISSDIFSSNTQCEALENHFHLFDRVHLKYRKDIKRISIAIARNLFSTLQFEYPNKKFIVYLDLNYQDSIIVRFHQVWEDEALYYDPILFEKEYRSGKLIKFDL